MIGVQSFGNPSFLGEIWFSESDKLTGPWLAAKKLQLQPDHVPARSFRPSIGTNAMTFGAGQQGYSWQKGATNEPNSIHQWNRNSSR